VKKYFSLSIIFLLLVFMGFYLNKNLSIIMETFNTTMSHLTLWFFAAAIAIFISYYFVAKSYQVVFMMNKLKRSVWDLYKLNLIGNAVNVVIPTAGVSQAFVYAEDAHRRGDSKAVAVNSVLVTYISDYSSIAVSLIISLIYLYTVDSAVPHIVIPALIFIFITIAVYTLSYFAGKEAIWLEKVILYIFAKIEKMIIFFTKKEANLTAAADKIYKNFKDVNKAILADPKDWFKAIFYAVIQDVFAILGMYLIFISLGFDPIIRVLIAAYSVGEVIRVVSPTPSGIGFVEGGMYFVLINLGVPYPIATTATIIYRGLIFWIPLAIGFGFYQRQKLKDAFQGASQD
jgi:uncharacterized protein (TIRG00374 family)